MEPLLISPSRISAFLSCPKRYDYSYNQQLVPKIERRKLYFDKGNYFHELAHVYYQMLQAGTQPGSDIALTSILSRIQNDIARTPNPDLIPVYGTITRMMSRYIAEQSPTIDKNIDIKAIESEIELSVTEEFSLYGYADLIYTREGRLHVRDHKTGSKEWTTLDARFSNQLLFYSTILWKTTGDVPIAEISYTNTHDYVKSPPKEKVFKLVTCTYTEKELQIYYEDTCKAVENMLKSYPIPMYGQHCLYCTFQTPCLLSRKGIDQSICIEQNFNKVERGKRHIPFTESNADDNGAD